MTFYSLFASNLWLRVKGPDKQIQIVAPQNAISKFLNRHIHVFLAFPGLFLQEPEVV
jgi:hypothetical protein